MSSVAAAPPPRRRRRGPLITLLVVVALVLAGGTVAVIAFTSAKSGGDTEAATAGISGAKQKRWTAPSLGSGESRVSGGWIVDASSVVYVSENSITGYALDSGKQLWQVRPPSGMRVCEMSPTAEGGIGAVGYGQDFDQCMTTAAIDARTGRQLWSFQPPRPSDFDQFGYLVGTLSVAGSTIVVDGPKTVFGYSARDGKQLWSAPLVNDRGRDTCNSLDALATGTQTAQIVDCDSQGVKIVTYDTATGTVKWTAKASTNPDEGTGWWLLSADPVVVADNTVLYHLPGPDRPPVRLDDVDFQLHPHEYKVAVFAGTTMITVNRHLDSGAGHVEEQLTAYDLTAGKPLWQHPFEANADASLAGVGDGTARIVYTGPQSEVDHQLLAFSLKDGSMIKGGTFSDKDANHGGPPQFHLVGPRVVEFGSPSAPVTVWE